MKKQFFLLLVALLTIFPLAAQYSVAGHVNLGEEWQPKVYLAAINKLSDYYRTSPDMIVNTAEIAPDGSFVLVGDNLPEDPRYYRLYLMKKQNTDYDACFYYSGDDHNFAHLILKNGERVNITTDPTTIAPFGNYHIEGSEDNREMRELARVVYPSFYFYRIKFPTELKFSENKLHTDLKQFADTSSNPLVALAAVNNMDFDEYFDQDREFYQQFGERLTREIPNSPYTSNYLRKIRYYANEEVTTSTKWQNGAMGLLSLIALVGWGLFFQLRSRQAVNISAAEAEQAPFPDFTPKELAILQLINAGKSNKEIAGELFVEVSTVKTHINKLYAKAGVSNRKDAREFAANYFV